MTEAIAMVNLDAATEELLTTILEYEHRHRSEENHDSNIDAITSFEALLVKSQGGQDGINL